jgi:hypothetical protein
MDASAAIATWLSFAVTAIGLGGLISQANAINDKMDPFHSYRNVQYLGVWFRRQKQFPWWLLAKPPPVGPVLNAGLSAAFCQTNLLYVTRLPLTSTLPSGRASWAVLLATFHTQKAALAEESTSSVDQAEKGQMAQHHDLLPRLSINSQPEDESWYGLERLPLKQYQNSACVTISRTTFITFLCLTNARKVFQYSDAAGFRAGYASYGGQWHVNWPVGQEAMVKLMPHDSHSTRTDVYPLNFVQRVDSCVHMQVGIVRSQSEDIKIAFCGRKPAGDYVLKFVAKGFPGAHGSRHLYNMMGGKVYEVEFMSAVSTDDPEVLEDALILDLPSTSTERSQRVRMVVPAECQDKIKLALDCLPWNSLSWSIHRGMRDILLAFGKPVMNDFRERLAALLKATIAENPVALDNIGWNPEFVRKSMGEMAYSAIMDGSGDSGDLVRVVTDAARVYLGHTELDKHFAALDEVDFWRLPASERRLDRVAVIALTKFFVLEWSVETDYQLYHQLPLTMNFG